MTITTKYNIDDEVYPIYKGHLIETATLKHWTWYPQYVSEEIDAIQLHVTGKWQSVRYSLYDPEVERIVDEEDCFITLAEAKAECHKRNRDGASDPDVCEQVSMGASK